MKNRWRIGAALVAGGVALALWTMGCEGDSLYEGLAVYPASIELRVGQSQVFRATGGRNYKWSFEPADGRLGLNTSVGDTVIATALANTAGEEATHSVVTLTCRSIIPGVTCVTTNQANDFATAYISIR